MTTGLNVQTPDLRIAAQMTKIKVSINLWSLIRSMCGSVRLPKYASMPAAMGFSKAYLSRILTRDDKPGLLPLSALI